MFYIEANLKDGGTVISEFQKAQAMRRFAADVFSGRKALPVWRVVGDTHPQSGEPVVIRTRSFVNGTHIASMQAVVPINENHGYDPSNFEDVEEFKGTTGRQSNGLWTAPTENTPDGAVAGVKYPVHRDEVDHRRYVILRVAEDVTPENRFYLDETAGVRVGGEDDDVEYEYDDDE